MSKKKNVFVEDHLLQGGLVTGILGALTGGIGAVPGAIATAGVVAKDVEKAQKAQTVRRAVDEYDAYCRKTNEEIRRLQDERERALKRAKTSSQILDALEISNRNKERIKELEDEMERRGKELRKTWH